MKKAVVSIVDALNSQCGSGFFVSGELILTTTVVINRALNRPSTRTLAPVADAQIQLGLPMVTVEPPPLATIVGWSVSSIHRGLAILKLSGELPAEIRPIHLLNPGNIATHSVNMVAFPFANAHESWVFGKLAETESDDGFQFEPNLPLSPASTPQFSGSPIWDDDQFGVVGIYLGKRNGRDSEIEHVISTAEILASFPEIDIPHIDVVGRLNNRPAEWNRPNQSQFEPNDNQRIRAFITIIIAILFFVGVLAFISNEVVTTRVAENSQTAISTVAAVRAQQTERAEAIADGMLVPLALGGSRNADFYAHYTNGRVKFEGGDYVEAIEFFDEAYELQPTSVDNLVFLGAAYAKSSDFNNAQIYFEEAESLRPLTGLFEDVRGLTYFMNGDYLKVIDILEDAPLTNTSAELLVQSYLATGQSHSVEKLLAQTIIFLEDETNTNLHLFLARSYADSAEYFKAIESFNRVLEIDPTHQLAFCQRSEVIENTKPAGIALDPGLIEIDLSREVANLTDGACENILGRNR